MSIKKFPGAVISDTPVEPAGPFEDDAASGVWTLDQQAHWQAQGLWPVPGNTKLFIEDVFSTYLYTGNGTNQTIENGIALGDNNTGPCVSFNGANQYLSRTSDFIGNADGSTFTLSFWAFVTNTYSTIFRSNSGRVEVLIQPNNVQFDFKNTSGTSIWRGNSNSGTVKPYQWNHILISVDAGSSAHIYINDVSSGISYVANDPGTFDFTDTNWGIGAYAGGSLFMQGKLTEFFFDKTYRNLGTEANRRLFITASGEPATGLASLNPLIYLPLNGTVSVGTNEGTGGDLVPIGGLSSSESGGPYTEAGYGEGGLVWIKSRSQATWNRLVTTTLGANKDLSSNSTAGLDTNNIVNSFNSNGFTLNTGNDTNINNYTYASWTFRKAPKFFDVVTYTGDGVAGRTVAHNLGSLPGCIIVKRTNGEADWNVYHRGINVNNDNAPETDLMYLNLTSGAFDYSLAWNDTAPTSTEFTLGPHVDVNASGSTYVAYLFAHDAGGFGDDGSQNVISCGSYTGAYPSNVTVNVGFEPQYLLVKNATQSSDWGIFDVMRGMPVGDCNTLAANSSAAENGVIGNSEAFEATATGFIVNSGLTVANVNGATHIYIAIRRPMKTPESGTEVFGVFERNGTGSTATYSGLSFAPDMAFVKATGNTLEPYNGARLLGNRYLLTNVTYPERTFGNEITAWNNDGVTYGTSSNDGVTNNSNSLAWPYVNWMFRRAPGFFDVVAYTGTGAVQNIAHNLGVAPELMIFKRRNGVSTWPVFSKAVFDISASGRLLLNETTQYQNSSALFNSTAPTSSVFTLGTSPDANASSGTYIAYLFATLPGVSKVGSYSGTGTTQTIDCGFSAGARFVLIKRTDSTGDWYVWDSARGIVAGNDPYLLLNSGAAEVTSTDYIDPVASGFEISSSAPAAINASGGTFIYLAIA